MKKVKIGWYAGVNLFRAIKPIVARHSNSTVVDGRATTLLRIGKLQALAPKRVYCLVTIGILHASFLSIGWGQQPSESREPTAAGRSVPFGSPASKGHPPNTAELESFTVKWQRIFLQSAAFLAIEHGFRWATEPGTRAGGIGLDGKYGNSIGNLHGWADGDPFLVNWVGHPMQGAVSGFIWTQNDPRYYKVEFGKNRRYWKSRFRAAAWSFVYSSQFEIGPGSEASIGHVQNSYPQQGLVDIVTTPTVGMGWLFAEDALDKYVIQRFENKFPNPYARLLLRGWLNPSRSLANIMAFRAPWHRETRAGIFSYVASSKDTDPQPEGDSAEEYPLIAPYEFSTTARVQRFTGTAQACVGGGANVGFRVAPSWQIVLDIGGCKMLGTGRSDLTGDSLTYQIGPRWTPTATKRWSPYAELLVGGNKITNQILDQEAQANFESDPQNVTGIRPPYPELADHKETNNFMISAATGVDVRLTRALAIRVAHLGYAHSSVSNLNDANYQNGFQFSSGVVLRMGTW